MKVHASIYFSMGMLKLELSIYLFISEWHVATGSSLAWRKVSLFFVIRYSLFTSLPLFPMFQFRHCNTFVPSSFFSVTSGINYWQEFSSDMGSRTVKRIADVSKLRNYQFPQVTFFSFFRFDYLLQLLQDGFCVRMLFWLFLSLLLLQFILF